MWVEAATALESAGVFEEFEGVPEYAGFASRQAHVLRLADRVVAATSGLALLSDIHARLAPVLLEVQESKFSPSSHIALYSTIVEPWFKAVFACALPKEYEAQRTDPKAEKRHNLYGVLQAMKMVSGTELEEKSQPGNAIRKIILEVRNRRNTVHSATPPRRVEATIADALIAMLAAVDRYRDELGRELLGLVVHGIADDVIFRQVNAEREHHLQKFRGRRPLVEAIVSKAESLRVSGGYLLLEASEGFGKSALACTLSAQQFGHVRGTVRGGHAGQVQAACPWLPSVLLHLGKQNKSPVQIVRSLVGQANTLLLKPMPLPPLVAEHAMEWRGLVLDSLGDSEELLTSGDRRSHRLEVEAVQRPRSEEHELQQALFAALDALVRERGSITFIVDALDELLASNVDVAFLPPTLPAGCVGILTSQPNARISELRQRIRFQTDPGLRHAFLVAWAEGERVTPRNVKAAMMLVTCLADKQDVDGLERILGRLGQDAPYSPIHLKLLGKASELGSASSKLELARCLRYGRGVHPNPAEGLALLREVKGDDALLILADWLLSGESEVTWQKLVGAGHIDSSDIAAYRMIACRGAPSDVAEGTVMLRKLVDAGHVRATLNLANRLIDHLSVPSDPMEGLALLRKLADGGHSEAIRILANRLIDGDGIPIDPTEGHALLRKLVEDGDVKATRNLASRLREGRGLPMDIEQSDRLLQKIAVIEA